MDHQSLTSFFAERSLPAYRVTQTLDFYFSHFPVSWDEVKPLPAELRADIAAVVPLCTVAIVDQRENGDVIKLVFQMERDARRVEGVIMKHADGRKTLCVSCQVGCPMGCLFCATGTMGLQRNLTAYEIVDMVWSANALLHSRNERITNVVYMGMGEPFTNYAAVKESITLLHTHCGLGWRKITVSTSGIPQMITLFADDFPQVNLALSLHAAQDDKRSRMMPINSRFPIADVLSACHDYVAKTKRKLFIEYLVIHGWNDTVKDADDLAGLMTHPLFHVNLIRFHATPITASVYGHDWQTPTIEQVRSFQQSLAQRGINCTIRRSFGRSLDAACGMLVISH